jgi:predicted nucleic acid-binding protein
MVGDTPCMFSYAGAKDQRRLIDSLGACTSHSSLAPLKERWAEVRPTDGVRLLTETLLHRYSLKTADAYQLAAAMRWRETNSRGAGFVCYDGNLKDAAELEGFTAVSPAP